MITEENRLIGVEQGREQGIIIGEDSKSKEISIYLYNHGVPLEIIAGAAGTTVEQIEEWAKHPDYDDINKLRHDLFAYNRIKR